MRAPLSPAQERLWLLQRLDPGNAAYNLYLVRALRGPLDRAALAGAFDDVLARHESLRTRFTEEEGAPWAVVEPPAPAAVDWPVARDRAEAERMTAERANAPFDLAQGPPLRIAVIRLGDDEHVLCVTMHHIVADGWSLNVILDDLAACYTARVSGAVAELAPLPVQAVHHALWQRSRAGRAVPYWREKLADPPPPELPFREGTASGEGDFHRTHLPPATARRLERLAGERRTTLFTVLMAAYQVLLSRHTGQSDVLVGSVFSGRDRAELEGMVGYVSQTVVLRGDLSGDPPFTELITRMRGEVLGAMAGSSVPFERLGERAESLLPSMLILHTQDGGPRRPFGDLEVTAIESGFRQAKNDLMVEAWSDAGGLGVSLCLDTGLFGPEAGRRLTGRFARLLESVAAGPDTPISELRIWTDEDEAEIRAQAVPDGAVGAAADAGTEGTAAAVPEMIAAVARRSPGAVAVVCGGTEVSYGELMARADALAGVLGESGVRPGDIVGVCLPRSVEAIVALLAVWRAGAAYLPLDPDDPDERLAFSLADASVVHVVTRRSLPPGRLAVDPSGPAGGGPRPGRAGAAAAPGAGTGSAAAPGTEPAAAVGAVAVPAAVRPADAAYVITTSGSTGRPKGVVVEHGAVTARVRWMRSAYGLAPGDHVVQFASLGFDAHVEEVFPTLAAGAALVLLPDGATSLPEVLATPAGRRVTVLDLPTAYWHALVEEQEEVAWPPGLRLVILGGEQVAAAAVERWRTRFADRVRLVNTYGPTEAAVIATAADLGADAASGRPPIGRPIGETSVHVLDERGRPLPAGATGELVIGGAGVARGYLGRPSLTAAAFVPDPYGPPGSRRYRTGDRARRRLDGRLDFLGRLDGQLKVRGFRIEPGEVESRLLDHPEVGQAFVTVRGEELIAYFTGTADPAELRARLERVLPRQLVPAAWVRLEALPLTSSGKVDRAALPEPDLVPAAGRVPPGTDAERLVAGIWEELLGVTGPGVSDDFFALGGHSLLATRVAARIRRATGVEVPVRTVFDRATIAGLAAAVEELLIAELAGMTDEEALRLLDG
ncbi:hypothetical protein Ppa06_20650 [Planomonospora parontospora subsp. parontospora]|uniref:Carrier domain-containing protein n=2 Tax=Planomonospora parontospora TaxID=58119 RepID=A0AA37BFB7_9ACTN|nr:non-ribosomal peptide synthetase [Planomonospora parontospora]GGK63005.1 hypothetical protein GCM10010126_22900 [Planomonospora parontospora]GII08267.1 hypothetical protein Ppa06_20650 [Planomonospora parontospora subsp. parontospora]